MKAVLSTTDRFGQRIRPGRLIVLHEWERLVLFRRGTAVGTLGPGAHRRWQLGLRGWRVDVRPWVLQLPTQEVPTADGITVKVTVAAQASIADPATFVGAAQDPTQLIYLSVQVALRDVLAGTSIEQLLADRAALTARLADSIVDVSAVGISLDRVEIKDIILPSELKRAQSEVLLARAQGQAALERARAETAALRSLLNAARLAAEHPALLDLRLLQQLSASSGHTVVLGGPASSLSRRQSGSENGDA